MATLVKRVSTVPLLREEKVEVRVYLTKDFYLNNHYIDSPDGTAVCGHPGPFAAGPTELWLEWYTINDYEVCERCKSAVLDEILSPHD